jgi:hypothetical protein
MMAGVKMMVYIVLQQLRHEIARHLMLVGCIGLPVFSGGHHLRPIKLKSATQLSGLGLSARTPLTLQQQSPSKFQLHDLQALRPPQGKVLCHLLYARQFRVAKQILVSD